MWSHLSEVSLVGAIVPLFAIILVANLALTLIHSLQELRGHLWRYFGAIAGVEIPDAAGVAVFFVGLTGGLWALALVGVAGWLPFLGALPTGVAVLGVFVLIGGRLSDSWFSHIRLDRQGYPSNPGLKSTPYYIAEAILLTVLFAPGLIHYTLLALIGLGVGGLLFIAVLPSLKALRVFESLRREPWRAGAELPSWVNLPGVEVKPQAPSPEDEGSP